MAFVGLMMRGAAVVALALSLSACAGSGDKTPPAEKTAAQLYSEAEAIYREGDNVEAAKRFDLVERRS